MVLQTFFLSKKGSQRSKYGGGQHKRYNIVMHYTLCCCCVFSAAGSFGCVCVCYHMIILYPDPPTPCLFGEKTSKEKELPVPLASRKPLKKSEKSLSAFQHPSPNVKIFWNFETQIWLEIITSRDAKSACFKGPQTSCTEIISCAFWPKFGRKRSRHVMDASCRSLGFPALGFQNFRQDQEQVRQCHSDSFRSPRFGVGRKASPRFVPMCSVFPVFLPICSNLRSLFSGSDVFWFAPISPICSDLFAEQTSANQGNPFLPTPCPRSFCLFFHSSKGQKRTYTFSI